MALLRTGVLSNAILQIEKVKTGRLKLLATRIRLAEPSYNRRATSVAQ